MNDKLVLKQIACPVCSSEEYTVFFEVCQMPILCNRLWPLYNEAINAPKGDIQLGFCKSCGHIFNTEFDPELIKYSTEYENSLHYSPRFQEYANTLAKRLISSHGLYDKDIIEIGCGKGDFLATLCELGKNRGIGFDPAYEDERFDSTEKRHLTFIKDYYSERYSSYKGEIICCRHVLEHIQFPRDFLISIHRAIGNRHETVLFFEVPNVMFTLKDLSIWDIIYEHCGYFSVGSLAYLFACCGFKVCDISEAFEGQFLNIYALPGDILVNYNFDYQSDLIRVTNEIKVFEDKYQSKVDTWRSKLEKIMHLGQRIVVWGGGSKGVTFLNTLKTLEQIKFVVDINPHKHKKYVPGTGQKIVPPEFLIDYQPDVIIVMNPVYSDEIRRTVECMNLTAKLLPV